MWFKKWHKLSPESIEKMRQSKKWKPSGRKWKKTWKPAWNNWLRWLQPRHNISWFIWWQNKWISMSEEQKIKISKSKKGQKPRNTWKQLSIEFKEKLSKAHIGKKWELAWNWKWWITWRNNLIRWSLEIKNWRKNVFYRDYFTCQKCKVSWGYLEAHHINNFADFEELRFMIDNWITLCKLHHKEFHSKYWKKNNTLEQLQEFLAQEA